MKKKGVYFGVFIQKRQHPPRNKQINKYHKTLMPSGEPHRHGWGASYMLYGWG